MLDVITFSDDGIIYHTAGGCVIPFSVFLVLI